MELAASLFLQDPSLTSVSIVDTELNSCDTFIARFISDNVPSASSSLLPQQFLPSTSSLLSQQSSRQDKKEIGSQFKGTGPQIKIATHNSDSLLPQQSFPSTSSLPSTSLLPSSSLPSQQCARQVKGTGSQIKIATQIISQQCSRHVMGTGSQIKIATQNNQPVEVPRCSGGKRVCVANCAKDKNFPLHKFPAICVRGKDREDNLLRCRDWIKISGNRGLLEVNPRSLNKNYFLCGKHFTIDQYCNQRRERLLQTAIPTVSTAPSLTDSDLSHYPMSLLDLQRFSKVTSEGDPSQNLQCSGIRKEIAVSEDTRQTTLSFKTSQKEVVLPSLELQNEDSSLNVTQHKKLSTKRICAAGCVKDKNSTLHKFPAICVRGKDRVDNLLRWQDWIKISGNRSLLKVNPRSLNEKYFLCSKHFTTDQYTNHCKERLLHTAIPTVTTQQCPPLPDADFSKYPLTIADLDKCHYNSPESITQASDRANRISHDNSSIVGTNNNCDEQAGPAERNNNNLQAESLLNSGQAGQADMNNHDHEAGQAETNDQSPDIYQQTFENLMNSFEWRTCPKCKERFFCLKDVKRRCCHSRPYCENLSGENDMDPGVVPDELTGLTSIEEQLIARIHPVVSVYKIKGHQYSYSGNVINFPQEVKAFAQKLPHNIKDMSSMITVRTAKDDIKYKDFQVRGGVVKRALQWLQQYNPYYFDIEISDDNLSLLPEDGNLYDFVNGFETEDAEENVDDDNITSGIEVTGIPLLRPPAPEEQIENVIAWPTIGKEAIDEFKTIGYVVVAFPTLFPYGRADLRAPRERKVSETMYFQHLMRYHDERFAKHSRFRFFALNSLMRWSALSDGGIFVNRHQEFKNMTVRDLKEKLKQEPNLTKKIMFQGNNIRGTKAYWYARGKELQAMIEQLGLPTIFLTLSAADLHWPELFQVLAPEENMYEMSDFRRRQLVQENPLIVDTFFMERVDIFLKEVLQKKYDVKDYWFRIEYQHRGSPHFHGLVWLNQAPDVTNVASASEEELQEIIRYFDELVSTIHPNSNEPPAEVHPSKRKLSEVTDMKQDLAQLLNRVQIHSKCSESYCLRKDKDNPSRKKCRFNFPAPLSETTKIECTDNDVKLIPKRNHTHLNKFNPYIIQSWRANIYVSPVLSERALINYLAKYISKSETKSQSLLDMIKSILEDTPDDKTAKFAIQRLFIKTCAERDFSAQETCHILMGTKFYSTGGRNFVSINFNKSSEWVPVPNENKVPRKSLLQKYKERQRLDDECLWNMAVNHNIKQNKKQNIVVVYPKIVYDVKSPSNEEFYRQQCLLFLPWKIDESSLLGNRQSWKELYEDRIVEIKLNKRTTTSLQVDSTSCNNEEDDEVYVDPIFDQEDWMALSRMGSNQFVQDTDLGLRELDLSFDWHSSLEKYEQNGGIPYLERFLKKSREQHQTVENIAPFPDVNFAPEQLQVINLVQLQTKALKSNSPDRTLPKRIIVQGKAGTGKSLVISAIVSTVTKEFGQDSILLLGPTGVSAVNISGATIHSKLRVNTRSNEFLPLKGIGLHEFQKELSNVKFVVIDEFSMVGCDMLHRIDERLRQATGKSQEQFGGLNIYLFGDVKQLAPIGDCAAYSISQVSFEALKGKNLYDSFESSVILKTIHRQQNVEFQRILNNISIGCVTKEDYDVLKTRFTTNVSPEERKQFSDAIHLYPKNLKNIDSIKLN